MPGGLVDSIDEDLLGIIRQKFVRHRIVCTVQRILYVNVGMEIILFCWREEKWDASDYSVGNQSIVVS